jgi:hypothetical protein
VQGGDGTGHPSQELLYARFFPVMYEQLIAQLLFLLQASHLSLSLSFSLPVRDAGFFGFGYI